MQIDPSRPRLLPAYRSSSSFGPVELVDGQGEVEFPAERVPAYISLQLEYAPHCNITFTAKGQATLTSVSNASACELTIKGSTVSVNASAVAASLTAEVENTLFGEDFSLSGFVDSNTMPIAPPEGVREVIFHVPNLLYRAARIRSRFGRNGHVGSDGLLVVNFGSWDVEIQDLYSLYRLERAEGGPDEDPSGDSLRQENAIRDLYNKGGYALTHVGKLSRADGQTMSLSELEQAFSVLDLWLTFMAGRRTGVLLPTGYSSTKALNWTGWRTCPVDFYSPLQSWMVRPSSRDSEVRPDLSNLSRMLDALRIHLEDSRHAEVIKRAVSWYVQALSATDDSTGIVLAQSGLEVLSWGLLVVDQGMSPSGFSRMTAADQLTLLFAFNGLPPAGRPELGELNRWAASKGRLSPAMALTEMRNSVVHPPRAPGKPTTGTQVATGTNVTQDALRAEARLLSVWYLEMCILKRLTYTGPVFDRVASKNISG